MNNLAPKKKCPGVQGNLNWMPGYLGNCLCCLYLNILHKSNVLIQVLFMLPKSKYTTDIKCPFSGYCLCCLNLNILQKSNVLNQVILCCLNLNILHKSNVLIQVIVYVA